MNFIFSLFFVSVVFASTNSMDMAGMIHQEFGSTTAPTMLKIAVCESRLRQYDSEGAVIKSHTDDVGIFQVNPVWFGTLEKAGIDPLTSEGNVKAARLIYDAQGIKAWNSSKHCWDKP